MLRHEFVPLKPVSCHGEEAGGVEMVKIVIHLRLELPLLELEGVARQVPSVRQFVHLRKIYVVFTFALVKLLLGLGGRPVATHAFRAVPV